MEIGDMNIQWGKASREGIRVTRRAIRTEGHRMQIEIGLETSLLIARRQAKRLVRYATLEVQSMFIIPSPPCLGLRRHCFHLLGDRG